MLHNEYLSDLFRFVVSCYKGPYLFYENLKQWVTWLETLCVWDRCGFGSGAWFRSVAIRQVS
jgi:hypothetical protein